MDIQRRTYPIWVQWEERNISFHKEEGFEEIRFSNRDKLLLYAAEKSSPGFAIQ